MNDIISEEWIHMKKETMAPEDSVALETANESEQLLIKNSVTETVNKLKAIVQENDKISTLFHNDVEKLVSTLDLVKQILLLHVQGDAFGAENIIETIRSSLPEMKDQLDLIEKYLKEFLDSSSDELARQESVIDLLENVDLNQHTLTLNESIGKTTNHLQSTLVKVQDRIVEAQKELDRKLITIQRVMKSEQVQNDRFRIEMIALLDEHNTNVQQQFQTLKQHFETQTVAINETISANDNRIEAKLATMQSGMESCLKVVEAIFENYSKEEYEDYFQDEVDLYCPEEYEDYFQDEVDLYCPEEYEDYFQDEVDLYCPEEYEDYFHDEFDLYCPEEYEDYFQDEVDLYCPEEYEDYFQDEVDLYCPEEYEDYFQDEFDLYCPEEYEDYFQDEFDLYCPEEYEDYFQDEVDLYCPEEYEDYFHDEFDLYCPEEYEDYFQDEVDLYCPEEYEDYFHDEFDLYIHCVY
jgi:hypothetical protein